MKTWEERFDRFWFSPMATMFNDMDFRKERGEEVRRFIYSELQKQKEEIAEMIDGMFGGDRNAPIVKEVVDDIIKKIGEHGK